MSVTFKQGLIEETYSSFPSDPYEYLPSPSPNSSDEILSEIRRQDVEQAVTFSLFSPNASVFLTSSDIGKQKHLRITGNVFQFRRPVR